MSRTKIKEYNCKCDLTRLQSFKLNWQLQIIRIVMCIVIFIFIRDFTIITIICILWHIT